MTIEFDTLKSSKNLVDQLDESKINEIGRQVINGYEIDFDSTNEWREIVNRAMVMAEQKIEVKNTPWENASNIKFPLIAEASVSYAARTLPEIIQNDNVVKAIFTGQDPDGSKYAKAERVGQYMSYQLAVESPDWENSLDDLLHMLPVIGTCFKKVYWNDIEKRNISELCGFDKVIVNYKTQSLETASRITHIITLSQNEIVERQRTGLFDEKADISSFKPCDNANDEDFPVDLLEQHCWLDLDEDGYKEPYIVTVHKDTYTVLRIVSRFKKVERIDGQVSRIIPKQYFVDYHFIRSPNGGFYSIGFGSFLLPINESINTLLNQLVDSGTLSVMSGGFLGRGLRIKNGDFKFKMGEWKMLDAALGQDIASQIYPMPTKEPSNVLFELYQHLVQVGRDLSSTNDTSQGKGPTQNVSQGSVSQMIEQTAKTFVAINKRLYRSLRNEYTKLYELNVKHLKQKDYQEILNDPLAQVNTDFVEGELAIHPVADPVLSSEQQRLQRAGVIQSLRTASPRAVDTYILQSMNIEQSTINKLLCLPDPATQPSPEMQKIQAEIQMIQANIANTAATTKLEAERVAIEQVKKEQEKKESDARIKEAAARVGKMAHDAHVNERKLNAVDTKVLSHDQLAQKTLQHNIDKDNATLAIQALQAKVDAAKVISDAKQLSKAGDEKE